VDQRALRTRLITLAALMMAAVGALPAGAAAQVRSGVATVTLAATVPAGATFLPAGGTQRGVFRGRATDQPGYQLVVNGRYRLLVVRPSSGAREILLSDGRPGLVRLDAVGRSLAAGLDSSELPVTVDLVLDPIL